MKKLKYFIKIVGLINYKISKIVSYLVPLMALTLFFEVICRYIFKSPTIYTFDLSIFMFGYIGLLSGGYVLKAGKHVNVDIFYHKLSIRGKAIADTITGILFFFFIVLVISYSFDNALFAFRHNEATASEWAPPVWHFKLMITIGALLLLLQGIAKWIQSLYCAITNKEFEL